jgi:hypothetical protein
MTFVQRMVGAARLDPHAYEEVEADRGATGQALAVVVLAAVAAGIGSAGVGGTGLVAGALAGVASWAVWAWLIWLIGNRWLRGTDTSADTGELLRALGFASAPGLLRVLGIVPVLRGLVFVVTALWMLLTMVVAVRQALDLQSTGRAVVICLVGWVLHVVIFAVLLALLRGAA